MIQLLNELQPEVDECHQSEQGQKLLQKIKAIKDTQNIVLLERKRMKKAEREQITALQEVQKEAKELSSEEKPSKRSRRKVERYSDLDYDSDGAALPEEVRQTRRQQTCDLCFRVFNVAETKYLCSICGTIAHLHCHGVAKDSADGDDVICRLCLPQNSHKKGKSPLLHPASENEEDDYQEDGSEDEEYNPPAASDSEADDEDGPPERARFAMQMQREAALEAKDEAIFLKSQDLADFVSREQPNDETRHMLALLSLPEDKIWVEDDLDDDKNLKLGLHLLYNKIQGTTTLHFGKSIHICYRAFPLDVQASMKSERRVNTRQARAAKKVVSS
jgi:hypothetical protein